MTSWHSPEEIKHLFNLWEEILMENQKCCTGNGKSRHHRRSVFPDGVGPFGLGVTAGDVGQLFDRLFDITPAEPTGSSNWTPGATIWEDEGGYHVELDLPGVSRDDLDVTMEEGRLVISAKREFNVENRRVVHNERRFGEVARSIQLPESIDPESIEASLDNGLLRVDLSKRPEVLPRKIEVQWKN